MILLFVRCICNCTQQKPKEMINISSYVTEERIIHRLPKFKGFSIKTKRGLIIVLILRLLDLVLPLSSRFWKHGNRMRYTTLCKQSGLHFKQQNQPWKSCILKMAGNLASNYDSEMFQIKKSLLPRTRRKPAQLVTQKVKVKFCLSTLYQLTQS